MKGLLRHLRRSTYVRNVAVLMSGTSIAQALTVAASPILSRLYDPAAYGVSGVVFAVAAPLIVIACLKYDHAVVIARDDEEAADLLALCFLTTTVIAVATFVVLLAAGDWISRRLGVAQAHALLLLVPLLAWFGGLFYAYAAWANRQQDYRRISASLVSQATGTTSLQIGLGLLAAGPGGLVVGRLLGSVFAVVGLTWRSSLRRLQLWRRLRERTGLARAARAHDRFPKYNAPVDLMMAFSINLPSIFLALQFGPAAAGAYWFTYRLLEMPSNVLGEAVRRVFYQRAAVIEQAGVNVLPLWAKTTGVMLALSAAPVAIIVLFAPPLFAFVFGARWAVAGEYAQWLVLWWATTFIRIPSAALIPVYGLQAAALVIEASALALRIGVLAFAAVIGDALTAVALYAIAGIIRDLSQCGYVVFRVRRQTTQRLSADTAGQSR